MTVAQKVRAILLIVLVFWTVLYLPVYFLSGAIFAPLSACQIPLLPVFDGIGVFDVFYGACFVAALVFALLGIRERFSKKLSFAVLPLLFAFVDLLGEYFCYQAAVIEQTELKELEAYYYFNGISPTPPYYFLVSMALDLLWIALILWPVLAPRLKRKRSVEETAEVGESGFLVTDNWEEILGKEDEAQDLESSLGEEYKRMCEKK